MVMIFRDRSATRYRTGDVHEISKLEIDNGSIWKCGARYQSLEPGSGILKFVPELHTGILKQIIDLSGQWPCE
jgi:hypothetical protein